MKKSKTKGLSYDVSCIFIGIIFSISLLLFSAINIRNYQKPSNEYHQDMSFLPGFQKEVKDKLNSDSLKGHNKFIDVSGLYARISGRRFFNEVVLLNNGMLTAKLSRIPDMERKARALQIMNDTVESYGGKFIFVQFPYKMDLEQELAPAGLSSELEINNETEWFVSFIKKEGIDVIDMIPSLAQTQELVEKTFYRTDHHWKPTAAFQAFRVITERIQALYPDQKIFENIYTDPENWTVHEIKNQFLGSRGKRTGIYYGGVDDLQWITPNFDTWFSAYIQDHNTFKKGNYEDTCLIKEYLDPDSQLYKKEHYMVYVGNNYSQVQYRNQNAPSDLSVLMIEDSFSLPVQTFMATVFQKVDCIDPRNLKEYTILEYVDQTKPDIVLFEINSGCTAEESFFTFDNAILDDQEQSEVLLSSEKETIHASNSANNYLTVYDEFDNNRVYSLSFSELEITDALEEFPQSVNVLLYDKKQNINITWTAFDIEYCNYSGSCYWTFQTPGNGSENLSLLIYAGIQGNTQNNGIEIKDLQLIMKK